MESTTNAGARLKTPKQEAFIYQLLQSSTITKAEFEHYWKKLIPKAETSFDSALLIDWLITTIRLRKALNNKKQRAHLKCCRCFTTENIKRYFNSFTGRQIVYCDICEGFISDRVQEGKTSIEELPEFFEQRESHALMMSKAQENSND